MPNCFESQQDLDRLLKEILTLDFWIDGSKAEMAHPPNKPIGILTSAIWDAVQEIGRLCNQQPIYMMINNLPPDVIVPKHRDWTSKEVERYHLPVITNERCWWWDETNGTLLMEAGHWYGPMPYNIIHQVGNLGKTDRIHLVVDLLIAE